MKEFLSQPHSDEQIEKLAELISIKTAEKYFQVTKNYVSDQIKLHTAECPLARYKAAAAWMGGVIGGIIVFVAGWIIKRL